jgi:SpoVK/Ycf46/Vps4 family AAA+-type ATPase
MYVEDVNFESKNYSIDVKALYDMRDALVVLQNMIGLKEVKMQIINQIKYYTQSLHVDDKEGDFLHTVIKGPPGVGKTELGKCLAKIYLALGITSNNRFNIVRRSDLIGEYLGHTAKKTQKAIDNAMGGVLFIDEAYSLGNEKNSDTYSKECLDTLNQNLSERKNQFICIIAGYEDSLDSCFFAANPGLRRRFNFEYTIQGYDEKELGSILLRKMEICGWEPSETVVWKLEKGEFIKNHKEDFKYFGGDMERWFTKIKISYSNRMFGKRVSEKKCIEWIDVERGFDLFCDKRRREVKGYMNLYI